MFELHTNTHLSLMKVEGRSRIGHEVTVDFRTEQLDRRLLYKVKIKEEVECSRVVTSQ